MGNGNISVDDIRSALVADLDKPSRLSAGTQVAGDNVVPSNNPDTLSSAEEENSGLDISNSTWGNQNTLQRHFDIHGEDFGASSPEDYTIQANEFYNKFQSENLPAIEYPISGRVGVYEPPSNTFGIYAPDETTVTFYKPKEGQSYFESEIDYALSRGGKVINPLPGYSSSSESSGGGGGGGDIDIFHPTRPLGIKDEPID